MLNGDERFINSDGPQIWAERFGNSGDPVVLLIMGTAAQGIGWPDELVEALVDGGRQVIRFDHRDTGRSGIVDFDAHPYTLTDMTADTLAVLDGHQIPAATSSAPPWAAPSPSSWPSTTPTRPTSRRRRGSS